MQKTNSWKEGALLLVIFLMLGGLFFSRAVVSISSILVFLFFLPKIKEVDKWKPYAVAVALIFLPVLVSGFWSANKSEWWRAVEVRIPLITVGLALSVASVTPRAWRWMVRALLLLTIAGAGWSTLQFLQHQPEVTQNYLKAQVMATPLDNDHIRFSWLVVCCVLLSYYLVKGCTSRIVRTGTATLMALLVIYLHLLSAKTGVLCLYGAAFIILVHFIFNKGKWKQGVLGLAMLMALPVVAYLLFPTLQNRVKYVLYDYQNYSSGNFIPGLSDGARVLSLKAGWDITKENSLAGVGFGDMKQAVNEWHQQHHPQSFDYERFLPLNEWLIYGTGSGIFGILLFSAGLFLLLLPVWKKGNIVDKALIVVLILPLVTDDTLESQFGVCIFTFFLMWLKLRPSLKEPANS